MTSLSERLASLSPEQRALLTKRLKDSKHNGTKAQIPAQSRDRNTFPLSFTQRRLWFLNQLEPDNPFYNIPSTFRFTGRLNVSALEESLNEMIRRHESLRTTFQLAADGQPTQTIAAPYPLALPIIDLQAVPEGDREAEALQIAIKEFQQPYDLTTLPLWRAVLLRLQEQEHLLVLTMHHTIFDGWSLGVFIRELAAIYQAFDKGRPSPLPTLEIQYADYAHWQQQEFQQEILDKQLGYWQQQLGGRLPILELPSDRPRPQVQGFEGELHAILLPLALYEALKALSRQEQATLFMTTLTAFYVLLHRYTGQEDITIGFPITGRNRQEIEGLMGPCVNTLVLRANLAGNPTFRELLAQVRDMTLQTYANQDLPFDRLVEALQPERTLSHNPLFQVMFTLQNSLGDIELDDLKIVFVQMDSGTTKFDLSLDVFEGPEGPNCVFEYSTDLYDRDRIQRMAGHYQMLLEGIVANPDRRLSELPVLTATEQQQLLQDWNQTAVEYPLEHCFQTLFETQVQHTPDAIAVVCEGESLTYAGLNQRANRLAHELVAAGVGADTVVPLLAERSIEFLVGMIGIFKAGGAYLPLDPRHPAQRLGQVIRQSQVGLVLASQGLTAALHTALHESSVEERPQALAIEPLIANATTEDNLPCRSTPTTLAYVLFTSGSTGTPKGVMIEHAGMLNHLLVMNQELTLTAADAVAQTASQCFDISVWQFLSALLVGGQVQILKDDVVRDPACLLTAITQQHIAVLEIVPSLLQAVLTEVETQSTPVDLSALRWLIPTGEALTPDLCRRWLSRYPTIPLLNAYGPAECADDVTLYPITEPPAEDVLHIPIGRPVANLKAYVLDGQRSPVPVGIPGELYIGGVGVGRGYLNDSDHTAEAFLENPFEPGTRLYKTGDLARYLPDGNLVFLGRADYQVKLRGFRVELGEIEAVLQQHPAVQATVVHVWEETRGDQRLVGYVVTQDGHDLNRDDLIQFLNERLPEYMVPATFVELPALPLTPNGKVDRKALPAPEPLKIELDGNYIGPRTPAEEMMAEIWCQAFGLGRVSIHDDFFGLGGHSLLAIQIVSQVRQAFQVELPLKSFFQTPTVAGLAAIIAERQGRQAEYDDFINALPQVKTDRANQYEPFPLTDVQQAYWIGRSADFELGNVSTHNYDELAFEDIDLDRFNQAWDKLIQRHEMLRAIVHSNGEQQVLTEVPPYQIPILDLRGKPAEAIEAGLTKLREEMSHQILDTSKWPVFDLRISLLDDHTARIHTSTDSLMFDAWSFVVLMRELVQLHQDLDTVLPALNFSFRDYVLAEKSLRDSAHYQRSLAYWQDIIPTLPAAPELPLEKNPSAVTRPHFTRLHNTLEPEVWRKLKSKATRRGMTATGILLAAYAETITTWSKDPQFTLNLTFLNRLPFHPQVNELVGEFTSLTLLGVDNSSHDPFEVRARRIQERLWSDLEHHYVSGIQVLRELKRQQGGVKTAKMPVVFTSALTLPIPDKENSPISLRPIHSITQTSQVMLDCGVWEDSGAMYCNWDVVEELFPPGMLQEMFAAFFQFLHQLADEEAIWSESIVPLVPNAQLEARATINATDAAISSELLHTLFAAQVAERSHQPAVITTYRTLTYNDLDRQSNQLAHRLQQLGARPNVLVAVVMEKGWEQVVATLGILKSGAAYLPIDPELPQERLCYLLAQSDIQVALTQSWLEGVLEWPDSVQRLCVDTADLSQLDDQPLAVVQQPEDLAYVIFTSGSTGLPKGVMIDHRGAVNTILDLNQRFSITHRDRVLALSALNFDLSVYDIFGLLAAGGAIVLPDAAAKRDPANWLHLMQQEGVTIWNSVPALMRMLVEDNSSLNRRLPASLRLVMMSGDWIPVSLPDQIRSLTSTHLQIISMGGATEASIWSILYPIETVSSDWQSIPYGRPMVNQSFHVLNDSLEPCPLWVTGHLYIGGIGLAQGYWRDEQKTAASFITHPKTGKRLYKTGDLGRYLPDGNIEFLGREDFQVKVQGYRIELGEIEAALLQHPAIRHAVVNAVGDRASNKRLIGYWVPQADCAEPLPDEAALRQFLRQKVAEYMVPAAFITLETLPLSANGKVDRKALPLVHLSRSESKVNFVAPQTATEQQLADIWTSLLHLNRVSITDDFFVVGGDSMLVVQMNNQIREVFNCELPLRQVFETPAIADLARSIEALIAAQTPIVDASSIDLAEDSTTPESAFPSKLRIYAKTVWNFLQTPVF